MYKPIDIAITSCHHPDMRHLKMSGPRSRYRGKVRRPVVLTFTAEGHTALAEGIHRTGLSRSDYIESLLRRAASRNRTQGQEEAAS